MFEKNCGYQILCKIAQILEGQNISELENVSADIPLFKYARLTSCDVERSFSQYKVLFCDNRQRFVMRNLETKFFVHCNSNEKIKADI